jgi:ribosome-associated heat shock protein Hsp15
MEVLRIDKWLWSVRVYKTRSQAADACKKGRIKLQDKAVKASHEVKIGEIFTIRLDKYTKTLKVIDLLKNRVGAKMLSGYIQDLTSAEEYEKLKLINDIKIEQREHGSGRPTKKDRRDIDKVKEII